MKCYFGDCLDGLPAVADGSVDMVFADLPYGVTRNPWDSEIDLDVIFPELWRVLKEDGVIVMTAQQPFTTTLIQHQRKAFRYDLVWDKVLVSAFLNANKQPLRSHESILVFYRRRPTYNPQKWKGEKNHSKKIHRPTSNYGAHDFVDNSEILGEWKHPRSIITFRKPHPSIAEHPTQKPVELIEWLIRTFTNEGDTVLDPCLGCGTTILACKNAGRSCIGWENNPAYWEICKKKLEQKEFEPICGCPDCGALPLTREQFLKHVCGVPDE